MAWPSVERVHAANHKFLITDFAEPEKKCNFAIAILTDIHQKIVMERKKLTREDAVARFMAAKQRKHEHAEKMLQELKKIYREKTGKEVSYYEIW